MKRIILILSVLASFSIAGSLTAQIKLEPFGLENLQLTSLDINYGILAVGSDRNGVYWQYEPAATDTSWMYIQMDSSVEAVYPHKSGPIGWAISAGINPGNGQPPFVFCSHMGGEFEANSMGIDPEITHAITDLDGFPDPTICGETYGVGGRILYRRFFTDSIWQPVYTGTVEGNLNTVKVRTSWPGVVLAGGADGFSGILLVKSLDFGETWENISPPGMIFGIDFAGATADTIFAAASNQIFRTVDGGATWDPVFQEGSAFHLTEIIYDVHLNTVYAAGGILPGGEAVLMASYDFGENWEEISVGDLGTILGLEFGSDNWVYFATRDEGVFRFRSGTTGSTDIPGDQMTLHQNYPNPFSTSTRIDYALANAAEVRLSVYNSLGAQVALLENENQPSGQHSAIWDASKMAGGVYYITLTANGQQAINRAVVMHH